MFLQFATSHQRTQSQICKHIKIIVVHLLPTEGRTTCTTFDVGLEGVPFSVPIRVPEAECVTPIYLHGHMTYHAVSTLFPMTKEGRCS